VSTLLFLAVEDASMRAAVVDREAEAKARVSPPGAKLRTAPRGVEDAGRTSDPVSVLEAQGRESAKLEESYFDVLAKLVQLVWLSGGEFSGSDSAGNLERRRMLVWQRGVFGAYLDVAIRKLRRMADAEADCVRIWLSRLPAGSELPALAGPVIEWCRHELERIRDYDLVLGRELLPLRPFTGGRRRCSPDSARARNILCRHVESVRTVRRDKIVSVLRAISGACGTELHDSPEWRRLGLELLSSMSRGLDSLQDVTAVGAIWSRNDGGAPLRLYESCSGSRMQEKISELLEVLDEAAGAGRVCEGFEGKQDGISASSVFGSKAAEFYEQKLGELIRLRTELNRRAIEVHRMIESAGDGSSILEKSCVALDLVSALTERIVLGVERAHARISELRASTLRPNLGMSGCSLAQSLLIGFVRAADDGAEAVAPLLAEASPALAGRLEAVLERMLTFVDRLSRLQEEASRSASAGIAGILRTGNLRGYLGDTLRVSELAQATVSCLLPLLARWEGIFPQGFRSVGLKDRLRDFLFEIPAWLKPEHISIGRRGDRSAWGRAEEGLTEEFEKLGQRIVSRQRSLQSGDERSPLADSEGSALRRLISSWELRLERKRWSRLALDLVSRGGVHAVQEVFVRLVVLTLREAAASARSPKLKRGASSQAGIMLARRMMENVHWSIGFERASGGSFREPIAPPPVEAFAHVVAEAERLYWKTVGSVERALRSGAEPGGSAFRAAREISNVLEVLLATLFDYLVELCARDPGVLAASVLEQLRSLRKKLPPVPELNEPIRRWEELVKEIAPPLAPHPGEGLGIGVAAGEGVERRDELTRELMAAVAGKPGDQGSSWSAEAAGTLRGELERLRREELDLLNALHEREVLGDRRPYPQLRRRIGYLERMQIEIAGLLDLLGRESSLESTGAVRNRVREAGAGRPRFHLPTGLAGGPGGLILVADYHLNRVEAIKEPAPGAGVPGPAWGGMRVRNPFGIALARDGRIVVTAENHVLIVSPTGGIERTTGGPGREPGKLLSPGGVAAGADGRIYVADSLNGRIQKFDRRGGFLGGWSGTGGAQMREPSAVALHPDGLTILVGEFGGTRILRFYFDGTHCETWRLPEGHFGPEGICALSDGRILVCCRYSDSLVMMDREGTVLGSFDCSVEIPRPVGVCEGSSGRVWIGSLGLGSLVSLDPEFITSGMPAEGQGVG